MSPLRWRMERREGGTSRAERSLDDAGDGARSLDVRLDGVESVHAHLLALVANDDERAAILMKTDRVRTLDAARGRGDARTGSERERAYLVDGVLCTLRKALHRGVVMNKVVARFPTRASCPSRVRLDSIRL